MTADDRDSSRAFDLSADEVLAALDGVAYAVDGEGRIVAYSTGAWRKACLDGNASELAESDRVIGRPLTAFVTEGEVRAVVERQLAAVLAGHGPVVYHFRCDAPDVRREMRMSILALGHPARPRGALYHSVVLHEAVRPPLDIYDHKALEQRFAERNTIPIVTMCAYCQRVRAEDSAPFVDAEDYYRSGGDSDVRVSHGVCADCAEAMETPDHTQAA